MDIVPSVEAESREAWREWLAENHDKKTEIWLIYYKKHTKKPSVSYRDSVEEALCFGWIDGILKRIDDERYTHRFTPRRKGSRWSPLNIRLAKKMIDEGLMTKAGLLEFEKRKNYEEETAEENVKETVLSIETENELKKSKTAWENFGKLSPSNVKRYVGWIQSAKRPETRERRLKDVIKTLENDEELGMR